MLVPYACYSTRERCYICADRKRTVGLLVFLCALTVSGCEWVGAEG